MRRLLTIAFVLILTACNTATPTAVDPQPTQVVASAVESEPTATVLPTADATTETVPQPAPTATVQAAVSEPTPTNPATEPAQTAADNPLLGATWEWMDAKNPGCDLLVFQPDGGLSVQADCQAGQGSYQMSGSAMQLTLPPDVVGDFTVQLAGVTTFEIQEGALVLTKPNGELRFSPQTLLTAQPAVEGSGAATLLYNARIYAGPGTEHPVVGALPVGTAAAVAVRIFEYNWWGLAMPGMPDGFGWIQASAADVANVEAVPYTQIELLQVGGDALLWPDLEDPSASVNDGVRIYAGPSESYVLVMAGLPGDTFYVVGKSEDGAYLVALVPTTVVPSGLGWVQTEFVESRNIDNVPIFKAPPAPGVSRFLQPEPGEPFASPYTYVNIRSGPGEEYTVYEVAARGEIYLITAVTPDGVWYKIQVPAGISSDYVAWIAAPNVRAFDSETIQVVQYPFPMPYPRTDTAEPLCQIVSQKPREYEIFKEGITFPVEIVIRNNTSATWSRGDVDFVYIEPIDGVILHTGPDRIDLDKHIAVGDSATVKFDAKSPSDHDGLVYGERWVVRRAGLTVCTFTYQIRTFTTN